MSYFLGNVDKLLKMWIKKSCFFYSSNPLKNKRFLSQGYGGLTLR